MNDHDDIYGEIKNFALATDLYQLIMAAAYYSSPYHRERKTIGIVQKETAEEQIFYSSGRSRASSTVCPEFTL